jgi:hypothetical protein
LQKTQGWGTLCENGACKVASADAFVQLFSLSSSGLIGNRYGYENVGEERGDRRNGTFANFNEWEVVSVQSVLGFGF